MAFAACPNRFIVPAACAALCVSLCAAAAFAAPTAPSRPAALDQNRIHSYYTDGEFDKVIKDLEAFLRSRRACSHAESVFIAKHLSVVYAAHPGTRELGRYHMYRLLDLDPGSDLLDMFVGDEVGGVFEKVGKEYDLRNPSRVAARKPAASSPESRPASAPARAGAKADAKATPARAASAANAKAPAAAPAAASARDKAPAPTGDRTAAPSRPRPVSMADARGAPVRATAASPLPSRDSAAARNAPVAETSRPAWKEPGLWIGGGAAFAVVAFTLFYSGSDDAPPGRTYVVPATAAR